MSGIYAWPGVVASVVTRPYRAVPEPEPELPLEVWWDGEFGNGWWVGNAQLGAMKFPHMLSGAAFWRKELAKPKNRDAKWREKAERDNAEITRRWRALIESNVRRPEGERASSHQRSVDWKRRHPA
jgi:hypothetical protein